MGVSLTFLYTDERCSDLRIVGIRRRTFITYLLVGQGTSLPLSLFPEGALYETGFGPNGDRLVINGLTGPGWLTAAAWPLFRDFVTHCYEDVRGTASRAQSLHPSETELRPSRPQLRE